MLPNNWNELTSTQRNQWLRDALKQDLVVTFTKIDGSQRVMPCTLREGVVPAVKLTENSQVKAHNPEVLSVWCTDKSAWRSFKVMNVVDVQPV